MVVYLKWFAQAVLSFMVSLICYITNPIVVLFCDADGELPRPLSYWQTWDDSCNPDDPVEHKQIPDIFLYNWGAHYFDFEGTTEELKAVNRTRWFSQCYNDDFSIIERLQRYICRVYWLTRNCSYGFAFWVFGKTVDADKLVSVVSADGNYRKTTGEGIFTIADSRPICHIFGYRIEWNNYLGWKAGTNYHGMTRFMIAHRVAFKIKKEVS